MAISSLYVALNLGKKKQKNSMHEFVIKPRKLVIDHFLTQNLSARFFRIIQTVLSFHTAVKVTCIDLLRNLKKVNLGPFGLEIPH